jgi:hypothetical protein
MSVLLFLGDMSGSEVILTLPFLLASAALYFLPTYIAWGKLIWAINTPRYAPPALEPTPADELNKLAGLRQAGYLTEDEFIQAKARVL